LKFSSLPESAKDKKEKGTTHFVNLDYPSAVKRYTHALEDLACMFDETPEQLDEKKALQLGTFTVLLLVLLHFILYEMLKFVSLFSLLSEHCAVSAESECMGQGYRKLPSRSQHRSGKRTTDYFICSI
jgi:hypothetical protein